VQSDILDHLLAIWPEFDLRVLQYALDADGSLATPAHGAKLAGAGSR
jgi:hypothetical protein